MRLVQCRQTRFGQFWVRTPCCPTGGKLLAFRRNTLLASSGWWFHRNVRTLNAARQLNPENCSMNKYAIGHGFCRYGEEHCTDDTLACNRAQVEPFPFLSSSYTPFRNKTIMITLKYMTWQTTVHCGNEMTIDKRRWRRHCNLSIRAGNCSLFGKLMVVRGGREVDIKL